MAYATRPTEVYVVSGWVNKNGASAFFEILWKSEWSCAILSTRKLYTNPYAYVRFCSLSDDVTCIVVPPGKTAKPSEPVSCA